MGTIAASDRPPEHGEVAIDVARRGGVTVLAVHGDVDSSTRGIVQDAVLAEGDVSLILDLSGIAFMDTAGVHLLIAVRERLGDRLRVIGTPPRVHRLLQLCGREDLAPAA
jgi:anti-sigma B factor antagonist